MGAGHGVNRRKSKSTGELKISAPTTSHSTRRNDAKPIKELTEEELQRIRKDPLPQVPITSIRPNPEICEGPVHLFVPIPKAFPVPSRTQEKPFFLQLWEACSSNDTYVESIFVRLMRVGMK